MIDEGVLVLAAAILAELGVLRMEGLVIFSTGVLGKKLLLLLLLLLRIELTKDSVVVVVEEAFPCLISTLLIECESKLSSNCDIRIGRGAKLFGELFKS